MKNNVLWRKISRIIMLLAETLDTTPQHALSIFYGTQVCSRIHDARYGLHLMSDQYILNDLLKEIHSPQSDAGPYRPLHSKNG